MRKRSGYGYSILHIGMLIFVACFVAACDEAWVQWWTPSLELSPEKVVVITATEEPDILNPLYSATWYSAITTDLWLRSLWTYDENNEPVPQVAVEVPSLANGGVSEDGKTITVKLREDAVWSDGTPVTADDYVFTFEMILEPQNTIESTYPYADYVESVVAEDDQTLVISFVEPFAPWLNSVFEYVLPRHLLEPVFQEENTLDFAEWNRKPTVGIGPYVFFDWESGSHLIFDRNDNWFAPGPLLIEL